MDYRAELVKWLCIWVVVCALVIRNQWNPRLPSVGLPFAYLLGLSMIHWFGGLIYSFPWYSPRNAYLIQSGVSLANVTAGFVASAYGVVGFGLGSIVLAPWVLQSIRPTWLQDRPQAADLTLPQTYLKIGVIFGLVLSPILSKIPGLNAIGTSGIAALLVGICLSCWKAWRMKDTKTFQLLLGFVCCMPLITIVTMGFIGYGAAAAVVVFMFVFTFYRPRWQVLVSALLVFVLGLSVFVTYLQDRNEIRAKVWGGQGLDSRIGQVLTTAQRFTIFNPYSQQHLESIDIRLNQNTLVGQSIDYLSKGRVPFASGSTLWQAAIAVIPRAIWPGKPIFAGSGNLVSQYTGTVFADGTSVGVGQVMEFYINFGLVGVICGFTVLGTVIRIIDFTAASKLLYGNWIGFASWFLPGLGLLQPGGAIAEMASSVAASVVLVSVINKTILGPKKRSKQPSAKTKNANLERKIGN
jgi:hypothetical protein